MADTESMIEEGEIESDGQEEVYKKVDRPQLELTSLANNTARRTSYKSDSSSSNSDEHIPRKKFLEKPLRQAASASISKNGSLWKNMLQEECLMENLKTCDVSSDRKRKYERGAESYDFEAHRIDKAAVTKNIKRRKVENDSASSSSSSSLKRKRKNRLKKKKPKILPDMSVPDSASDELFGQNMAQNLEEAKCELIVKVVSVIGREASLNLYKITQKIEREGGMLTMYKDRRRTPGGIFLFLLKSSDKISEDAKTQIFESDKKKNERSVADRKMSSEQTEAKDPPNSPANSEIVGEPNKVTDPDLVSQRILNLDQNDDDDLLEINYNMDF